ncbi:hypothetical protein TNCV_3925791 [Trichonephila clavipes]|nr:hypothetical protein TNCV_3925791 [Trichonephila clavipes]
MTERPICCHPFRPLKKNWQRSWCVVHKATANDDKEKTRGGTEQEVQVDADGSRISSRHFYTTRSIALYQAISTRTKQKECTPLPVQKHSEQPFAFYSSNILILVLIFMLPLFI